MIQIPEVISPTYDRSSISKINKPPKGAVSRQSVMQLNRVAKVQSQSQDQPKDSSVSVPSVKQQSVPALVNLLSKGQKTNIGSEIRKVRACFGWNVLDQRCDIDASAFLLGANGKVIDDSWFVFYSQPQSPDGSTVFSVNQGQSDRETIFLDLTRVNPNVKKIVFVLTINEAFENNLNFSMVRDTYIRLLDDITGREILSYRLEENYANVTSMTVAEVYLHNGNWKMNPVGNGMHVDLAGQCAIYGVEIE